MIISEQEAPYGALSYPERQKYDQMVLLMLGSLARYLGDEWIAERTLHHWVLTGPEGERLRVRTDEGRIVVDPLPPVGVEHWRCHKDEVPRSITLSPKKTVRQIARDVERRVLPGYRALLPGALEAQQKRDDEVTARGLVVAELYRVLSGMGTPQEWRSILHGDDRTGVTVERHHYGQDRGSITVEGMSVRDATDTMKLRVPRSKVVDVCAAVAAILAD